MKSLTTIAVLCVALAAGFTVACSDNPPKAPDVSSDIRHALDQGGLNEVSVSGRRPFAIPSLAPEGVPFSPALGRKVWPNVALEPSSGNHPALRPL